MNDAVLLDAKGTWEQIQHSNVVLIDTRDPDSFAAGHIAGAVNVHDIFTYLATSTPEGMKELTSKFAKAFGDAGLSGKELAIIYEWAHQLPGHEQAGGKCVGLALHEKAAGPSLASRSVCRATGAKMRVVLR